MSLLDELNDRQKEACTCVDTHVRIIAGAGSGKTKVVTTRIAYLMEELGVYPNRILAITFTNKAAKEMKERVEKIVGEYANAIRISTIHSFCVRLLREDIQVLNYPRNFTILDSDDSKAILKEAYKEYSVDMRDYSYVSMLNYISNCKMAHVTPKTALEMCNNEKEEVRANVYDYYQSRLKKMFALDFDDLLLFTHRILMGFEDVALKWQRRFDYIHVDEFQDVDEIQYEIIKQLVGPHCKLCVVGDPDQTIYTWRGAKVDIILNFNHDFKGCKSVILNQNYRSTTPILEVANKLIKHNKNRLDKDLFTMQGGDDKVLHYNALDDQDEPRWVAIQVNELHRSKNVAFNDIAVLYRSNYLSRGLEKEFVSLGIPYTIYGGIRFYDRQEIKDALSYLRLLLKEDEADPKAYYKDLALKRVINTPKRGVGPKGLENLEAYANEHECNLYDALKNSEVLKGKAKIECDKLIEVIENCRQVDLAIDLLLDKVLEDSGYMNALREDKEVERIENIKELKEDMASFMEDNPQATLNEYLQEISLFTDKEQIDNAQCVKLMSVHAAKGLEFDHVFVYNLCEGIFPNERSINEGGLQALEEERRLAYVAFTRAKKRLYLSNSSGYSYVLDRLKMKSRFFKEIPSEYVEEYGMSKKESSLVSTTTDIKKIDSEVVVKGKSKKRMRKGDIVIHDSFGEGVVLKVDGDLVQVAFNARYGVRKLMASHPSLHRK